MSREEIYEKLTEIFEDVFNTSSITLSDTTSASDIEGWDSLTHIVLIAEVEDAFGIKFTMQEVIDMKCVGELVGILERKIS